MVPTRDRRRGHRCVRLHLTIIPPRYGRPPGRLRRPFASCQTANRLTITIITGHLPRKHGCMATSYQVYNSAPSPTVHWCFLPVTPSSPQPFHAPDQPFIANQDFFSQEISYRFAADKMSITMSKHFCMHCLRTATNEFRDREPTTVEVLAIACRFDVNIPRKKGLTKRCGQCNNRADTCDPVSRDEFVAVSPLFY